MDLKNTHLDKEIIHSIIERGIDRQDISLKYKRNLSSSFQAVNHYGIKMASFCGLCECGHHFRVAMGQVRA